MSPRNTFLIRHLAPVLPVIVVLLMLEKTDLDSVISGWFFDPVARSFPLRYNIIMESVGHHFMKDLVIIIGAGTIAMYVLSFLLTELGARRRLLLFLALALTLAPLAVSLLKATSIRHCPWNLEEYGGFAPHLSLFDAAPHDLASGHCFPGGHASAGFSLLAFHFAGRALKVRWLALLGLWAGIMAGMAFGMTRVAQGAHFVSHNLWSALVCWLVIVALYAAIMRAE